MTPPTVIRRGEVDREENVVRDLDLVLELGLDLVLESGKLLRLRLWLLLRLGLPLRLLLRLRLPLLLEEPELLVDEYSDSLSESNPDLDLLPSSWSELLWWLVDARFRFFKSWRRFRRRCFISEALWYT